MRVRYSSLFRFEPGSHSARPHHWPPYV